MPFKGEQWKDSGDSEEGLHSSKHRHPEVPYDDHGVGPFGSIRRGEFPTQEEGLVHIGTSYEERVAMAHGHLSDAEIDAINSGAEVSSGASEHYMYCSECQRSVSHREKFQRNSSWE